MISIKKKRQSKKLGCGYKLEDEYKSDQYM